LEDLRRRKEGRNREIEVREGGKRKKERCEKVLEVWKRGERSR